MAVKISRNVWIGGVVAGVAVLAVGVGWALAGPGGDADASPEVKVTVTAAAPVASSSPEPSVSETVDPYADDLDGILDDEYPEAAPTRDDPNSDQSSGTHIAYPQALVMEDWVWDRVGPGWEVEVVSTRWYPFEDEGWVQPAAVVYLVSPEDVRFDLGALPERMWDQARVVSWVEDDDYIRVTWSDGDDSGRFDLRDGTSDDIVFAAYGSDATRNAFVAADAEGNELWSATSENGTKLYRWDAARAAWAAASVVEDYPEATAWWDGIAWTTIASADGESVLLFDEDAEGTLTGDFLVYDLASDTAAAFTATAFAGLDWYTADLAIVDGAVVMRAYRDSGDVMLSYAIADGTLSELSKADWNDAWNDDSSQGTEWDGTVGYGEATNPGVTFWTCGC
ncbi:hypothetical protein [Demequina sp. NBRC 110054]|uniref:hypothetical protein n=1 Tax=Demequina sp. NBRC 110054 TaxID=1570343 RepID=UPI0009FCB8AE|nr:hypothetical protein [Demequina sp. NBRC 110054]